MIPPEIEIIKKHLFKKELAFEEAALRVFQFQYRCNPVYQQYANALGIDPQSVRYIEQIPFLPIGFFKTQRVATTDFHPQAVFESSGTTATINSRHFIKELSLYEESFTHTFTECYGDPSQWCILGLLPSYIERQNSSLVYMVDRIIKAGNHRYSGFFPNNFSELAQTIQLMEQERQKVLLIGVTFALLDFAAAHPMALKNTVVMETGGMKGRREEIVREEVHQALKNSFGLQQVHSEYGMTELLSQAYSTGGGIFRTPRWMKVLVRDTQDPLAITGRVTETKRRGIINIIDLANLFSCSFIATDDLGVLHPGGQFEVIGRVDNSDVRGCSLLAV